MEAVNKTVKAGPFTLALGLIALGAGIMAANFGLLNIGSALKLWPVLLIGLGLEYFLRKLTARGREVQFSLPSTVLICLIAVLIAAANALYGLIPGLPGSLLEGNFFGGGAQYTRQWQSGPVALARGSRLEVENRIGEIEVLPSPDGSLRLSARITGRGTTRERARQAAEAQQIAVEPGQATRIYTGRDQHTAVNMRLEVPAGLKIALNGKMGNIKARGLSAESLEIENSMGRVEVSGHSGRLKTVNKMGDTTLEKIDGDIEADNSLGRISVINPLGSVTAHAGNGSVDLASDSPLDKKYSLTGDNGQVTFTLPRESNLRIQARTEHGAISGVEIQRPDSGGRSSGELTLGSGAGSALLETKNGAIRVDLTD